MITTSIARFLASFLNKTWSTFSTCSTFKFQGIPVWITKAILCQYFTAVWANWNISGGKNIGARTLNIFSICKFKQFLFWNLFHEENISIKSLLHGIAVVPSFSVVDSSSSQLLHVFLQSDFTFSCLQLPNSLMFKHDSSESSSWHLLSKRN